MENEIEKPGDPLFALKQFTAARIALGRTGNSEPLAASLAFKLAHANARDAVYSNLNFEKLYADLQPFNLPVLQVNSCAVNRQQFLQRPDFGRLLNGASKKVLADFASEKDVVVVISDGLSADAINNHAIGLLDLLLPKITDSGFKLAPLVLAAQARVALGDEIGHLLKARLSLVLIGERPGLTSPNSMGIYLTYQPKPGLGNESRNCVSNISPGGLSFHQATEKIFYLVKEALHLKLSGVRLKDNSGLLGF